MNSTLYEMWKELSYHADELPRVAQMEWTDLIIDIVNQGGHREVLYNQNNDRNVELCKRMAALYGIYYYCVSNGRIN